MSYNETIIASICASRRNRVATCRQPRLCVLKLWEFAVFFWFRHSQVFSKNWHPWIFLAFSYFRYRHRFSNNWHPWLTLSLGCHFWKTCHLCLILSMPTKTNGCHFLKISLLCPNRQSIAKIHGWQILKQGRLCLKRLSHTHFKENRGLPTINKATSRLVHNK